TSPVHAHAEEKKRVVSGKREFYVSFNQLQPVKAIVARKRPKKTVSTINVQRKTKSQTEFQSNQANTLVKKCSKERSMNLTENAVQTTFPIHHKPKISTLLQKDHHVIGQPTVCPFNEKLFSEQRLESLDIHPHSKKNIADLLNYTRLTMVQSMAIPKLLMGNDALIRSQTGSGKTLAYALPLIERLHAIRPKICRTNGILAVVIVPTRELAVQTYELFLKLLKPFSWVVPGYLTGGEKRKTEKGRLRAGLNIIIGTPGRLCDHIRNTESLKFLNVHWLVLDEADRMLELGYEKDIKEIIDAIRTGKKVDSAGNFHTLQTVLLSATLTTSVKELAGLTLHDPVCIETSEIIHDKIPSFEDGIQHFGELLNMNEYVSLPATVKQRYMIIPPKLRLVVLSGLIAFEQRQKPSKILVFMATQDLIDFHYNIMVEILTIQKRHAANEHVKNDSHEEDDLCHVSGMENNKECNILLPNVKFFKLHGRMTQIERTSVFQTFRKTKAAVLLCTDVAARGIDVPLVDLVVQYHAPHMLADYVHRVGRTARAGESGKAILFMEPAEVEFIQYLSSKHIRIEEQKSKGIFMHLGQLLKTYHKRNIMNTEQCSFELQHRYEQLVSKEKELFNGASKGTYVNM
uniref:ATP-dependent RNA helicase n=1 Tax=Anopheles dirus TaxID=7168 RepID=A0A182MZG5_9DIPT